MTVDAAVDDVLRPVDRQDVTARISGRVRRSGHGGQVAAAPAVRRVPPQFPQVTVDAAVDDVLRSGSLERVAAGIAGGRGRADRGAEVAGPPPVCGVPPQFVDVAVAGAVHDVLCLLRDELVPGGGASGGRGAGLGGQAAAAPAVRRVPPELAYLTCAVAVRDVLRRDGNELVRREAACCRGRTGEHAEILVYDVRVQPG